MAEDYRFNRLNIYSELVDIVQDIVFIISGIEKNGMLLRTQLGSDQKRKAVFRSEGFTRKLFAIGKWRPFNDMCILQHKIDVVVDQCHNFNTVNRF